MGRRDAGGEFSVALLCVRGRLVVSTYCVPGPHALRGTCRGASRASSGLACRIGVNSELRQRLDCGSRRNEQAQSPFKWCCCNLKINLILKQIINLKTQNSSEL